MAKPPGNRVLALSSTHNFQFGEGPRYARAQLASPSCSKVLKVSLANLALQLPPSDSRQMEIRTQRILRALLQQAQKPHIAAPGPSGLLPPLWAGTISQRQERLDPAPLGEPRVPAQCLPALRLISQWLLSPGRGAGPSEAHRVMSQPQGHRVGGQKLKKGLLRLGEVKVLSNPPPSPLPPDVKMTTPQLGPQRSDSLGPRQASKCGSRWKERVSHGVLGGREAGPSAHTLAGICRPIARG